MCKFEDFVDTKLQIIGSRIAHSSDVLREILNFRRVSNALRRQTAYSKLRISQKLYAAQHDATHRRREMQRASTMRRHAALTTRLCRSRTAIM